jgi:hypothetical protein
VESNTRGVRGFTQDHRAAMLMALAHDRQVQATQ